MYGTIETPNFQRQTRDFAAAGQRPKAKPVTLIVAAAITITYDCKETMANPIGWAGRAALAMMGLGKA
jgi:arylformamidase